MSFTVNPELQLAKKKKTRTITTTATTAVEEERYPTSISVLDNGKPTLVVHVGPLKTGTSAFQYALQNMNTSLLDHDGYMYFGRKIRMCQSHEYAPGLENETCYRFQQGVFPRLRTCMEKKIWSYTRTEEDYNSNNISSSALKECFAADKKQIKRAIAAKKQNNTTTQVVILSEEKLSTSQYHIPEGLGDEFNVVTVVGYRRLWQWLPSRYFQENRLFDNTGHVNSYKCKETEPILSIAYCIKDTLIKNKMMGRLGGMLSGWTERVADRYKKQHAPLFLLTDANRLHDHPVSILNFHAKDGQLVEFLCNMLPDATSACNEARSKAMSSSYLLDNKSNPRIIDYDALGCAGALENNLVDHYSRLELMKAVQDFVENKATGPLPQKCLDNQTLEYLWDESIRLERELVPRFYYETDQTQHRKDFDTAVAKGKFCSVDTRVALNDKVWQSFFQSLKKKKNEQ